MGIYILLNKCAYTTRLISILPLRLISETMRRIEEFVLQSHMKKYDWLAFGFLGFFLTIRLNKVFNINTRHKYCIYTSQIIYIYILNILYFYPTSYRIF